MDAEISVARSAGTLVYDTFRRVADLVGIVFTPGNTGNPPRIKARLRSPAHIKRR